ncbi:MAG: hypothetical protein LIR46_12740 [Bacteroidota bacterium]|nr:hypothetical protein [Bacteroidota bacterium]
MAKEAKTVNFGLTDEVMNYLEEMTKKYGDKGGEKEKEEKPGKDVKFEICDIAKGETLKIKERLNKLTKDDIGSNEWDALMDALCKIKETIAYI